MSTEFKDGNFKSIELGKCPITGAGTSAKFSAGRGQTNRDFWPNSLNLKILSLDKLESKSFDGKKINTMHLLIQKINKDKEYGKFERWNIKA